MLVQQSVFISRPMEQVVSHLERVDIGRVTRYGWLSFERARGGTRVTLYSRERRYEFQSMATRLLASLACEQPAVRVLVFEP